MPELVLNLAFAHFPAEKTPEIGPQVGAAHVEKTILTKAARVEAEGERQKAETPGAACPAYVITVFAENDLFIESAKPLMGMAG